MRSIKYKKELIEKELHAYLPAAKEELEKETTLRVTKIDVNVDAHNYVSPPPGISGPGHFADLEETKIVGVEIRLEI